MQDNKYTYRTFCRTLITKVSRLQPKRTTNFVQNFVAYQSSGLTDIAVHRAGSPTWLKANIKAEEWRQSVSHCDSSSSPVGFPGRVLWLVKLQDVLSVASLLGPPQKAKSNPV